MFKEIINNTKKKITKIKQENENYLTQLKNSSYIQNLYPIPNLDNIHPIEGKITKITELCPDTNKTQATTIAKLIPISETYLTINYIKEIATNKDYTLITTNQRIWLISNVQYTTLNYQQITKCNIIKNNIMGKIINLNNIILDINGKDKNIETLTKLLTNQEYRTTIIQEKTSYLLGINPTFQLINNIYTGISLDNNQNIVFHTKNQNYLYNYKEITNYELLLDNNLIMGKQENTFGKITSMQNSCYSISIRITTTTNTFILPILEPNSMNTKYTYKDSIYITNITFAKEIINTLNTITNPYQKN